MEEYGLGPNVEILSFERVEDGTIWTKTILLYHVLIPHCVGNIDGSHEWKCYPRRVKVNDIDMIRNKKKFLLDDFKKTEPETKLQTLIAHPV
jgi:hypothetical protein